MAYSNSSMTFNEIKRSLVIHGNLAPVALDYLGSIPEPLLHHRQHRLRHPWSLYKISVDQVFTSFADVVERCDRIRSFVSTTDESRQFELLMSSYKNFLYTLREHIDDCYLVFKTLVPAQASKPARFQRQFLENAGFKELEPFEHAISWYVRDHLSPLVNTLKHHQGRLRWIYFHGSNQLRPGYYLEQVGDDGAVGPAETIHKGNTAFSFCRDIKLHLFALYYISEKVVDAVSKTVEESSSLKLNPTNRIQATEFRQALESVAKIELDVFPNELHESCALVELLTADGDTRLRLSYPEDVPNKSFPAVLTISGVPMWADDFTRTFRLPYWQPGKQ